MRIWSLHPQHLDRMGLVACWREALLAQAVLAGRTRGYQTHPQLARFRALGDPLAGIGAYLGAVADEAVTRGYRFDASRILQRESAATSAAVPAMTVTDGQVAYEWEHLGRKLAARSPADALRWETSSPDPHPLLTVVPGPIEEWERP